MEKNYRITFSDGPLGDKRKDVDVRAANIDEAFKMAYKMPEAKGGLYTDIGIEEIVDGPKVIGLEVEYADTVFKQNFTGYVFIRAYTEKEAVAYYDKHMKNKRFVHNIGEEVENGKCIRGRVKRTYFAGASGHHADATIS